MTMRSNDIQVEIEGRVIRQSDFLSPVTYVPHHAKNTERCSHPDCEPGVLMDITDSGARVLYSKSRTVQMTSYDDLVWG